MATSKNSPDPVAPPGLTNPSTGLPAPTADMRAEFERLSRQTPRDPEAERAFLEARIELIRSDPRLSEEEKKQAIEEVRRRFDLPAT